MTGRAPRLLYLDGYTVADPRRDPRGAPSSDSIGYGITASSAIRAGLGRLGIDVRRPRLAAPDLAAPDLAGRHDGSAVARLRWLVSTYPAVLDELVQDPPDAVFTFHAFAAFPVEIRRMLLDLRLDVPLVGYTHGSHWDPTDSFRVESYPGMELADLANLHVLDRVLLVSNYLRETLWGTIAAFNAPLAKEIDAKAVVVGLPLDTARIDAARTAVTHTPPPCPDRPTIVFNHAPVVGKNPQLFVRVMDRVLPRYDVRVLFTRRFTPGRAGAAEVAGLAARFPAQVLLGEDLPLDDYYRALWQADLQVSTATHESLGVSTLEAMYTGTCCTLPRLGSYPEIVNGHPDVLYDPGEGPLEERVCWFLDHPQQRSAVAGDLQRLTAKYHPDVVTRDIADVLWTT